MRRILAAVMCSALLCACAPDNAGDHHTDRPVDLSSLDIQMAASLTPFDSCQPFLRHVKANALDMVGPWGLEGEFYPEMLESSGVLRAGPEIAVDSADSSPEVAHSSTNIQEVGVDEPDIVKTDGKRIVAIVDGELRVVDATGDRLRPMGQLRFEDFWPQDMFLSGDNVVVFGQMHNSPVVARSAINPSAGWTPITTLISVDIGQRKPRITRQLHLDGSYVSSRLVDNAARIVLQSRPTGLEWSHPKGTGLRAERRAEEQNRKIIRESTIDNWIPWFVLENGRGRLVGEGTLTPCDRIYHPPSNSGLRMLNIVTIDLGGEIAPSKIAATSVLADGQTVYSSQKNMYVATTEWFDQRQGDMWETEPTQRPPLTTRIHKFDISDPTHTRYRNSGQVIGTVLNQYSMSEHDGYFRVATTDHKWWSPDGPENSESHLTILQETDEGLTRVGHVGNIGKGERIYAVRFLGDLATVVTFRQTDPLYTIDLSQPKRPRVLGELKILGYSAYLHPLDDSLLLGVGQDALDTGRTLGTQVSLFDISDLSQPKRIDQWQLAGASSEIEFNARAFLHWRPENLFVLPVVTHRVEDAATEPFVGAIALELKDKTLRERGRVSHLKSVPKVRCDKWFEDNEDDTQTERQHCWVDFDWRGNIQRSLVIGQNIHSLSSLGIMTSDIRTLEPVSFLAF